MYILIISIIVFAASLWYGGKKNYPSWVAFIISLSGVSMFASAVLVSVAPYEFEMLASERTAIKITHIDLRMAEQDIERYGFGTSVVEWNTKMYQMQKLNRLWITGQFIDDRVDELEPLQLPR